MLPTNINAGGNHVILDQAACRDIPRCSCKLRRARPGQDLRAQALPLGAADPPAAEGDGGLWCGGRRPLPATNRRKVIVATNHIREPSTCRLPQSVWISPRTCFRSTASMRTKVLVRKQLRRSQVIAFFKALPPCLIGMEACATAHYWARELTKLGHEVRLMPAKDVKAYGKRNKNDAADAEAICEAVRRPRMRFVRAKSAEQQGRLMQHRARDLLLRQQTQVINALR